MNSSVRPGPAGPSPSMKPFTVASANRTLPLVRVIVRDIVALYHDVSERRERLESLRSRRGNSESRRNDPYREEVEQMHADLQKDVDRLRLFIDELQGLGVELKDPAMGLVDFPTIIDGQSAYLCWKLDESQIGFWHALDSGFTGRQPLSAGQLDHAI